MDPQGHGPPDSGGGDDNNLCEEDTPADLVLYAEMLSIQYREHDGETREAPYCFPPHRSHSPARATRKLAGCCEKRFQFTGAPAPAPPRPPPPALVRSGWAPPPPAPAPAPAAPRPGAVGAAGGHAGPFVAVQKGFAAGSAWAWERYPRGLASKLTRPWSRDPHDLVRCIALAPLLSSASPAVTPRRGVCAYGLEPDILMNTIAEGEVASVAMRPRPPGPGPDPAPRPLALNDIHGLPCILRSAEQSPHFRSGSGSGSGSRSRDGRGGGPASRVPQVVYTVRGIKTVLEWAMGMFAMLFGVTTPGILARAIPIVEHWRSNYRPGCGSALEGAQVAVVGHSLGGTVAILAANIMRDELESPGDRSRRRTSALWELETESEWDRSASLAGTLAVALACAAALALAT